MFLLQHFLLLGFSSFVLTCFSMYDIPIGPGCPYYVDLWNQFQATSSKFNSVEANLSHLASLLSAALGVSLDVDRLGQVRDHTLARACHSKPPYAGLTGNLFNSLNANYTTRYYLKRATNDLKKFAIGPFFNNVIRIMKLVSKGQSPIRYAEYSGHDSSLVAVNAVLDVPQIWPPYTSYKMFELWRDDASGKLFVQVLGDGEVLKPAVFAPLSSPMIPFDKFVAALNPISINEDDWRSQCNIKSLTNSDEL